MKPDINQLVRQLGPVALAIGGMSLVSKTLDPKCPACGEPLKIELRYPEEEEVEDTPKPKRRRKKAVRRKTAKKTRRRKR